MDDESRLRLGVAGDGRSLDLGWCEPAAAGLRLDAAAVDRLIARLVALRAAMDPPVRRAIDRHEAPTPVADRWGVGKDALSGDPVLTFRHPGLGWLSFGITRQAARRAAAMLVRVSEAPPPGADGRIN
ncbi:MAG: hypothetical protein U1E53_16225 [Dongiaceae bacterium]